MKHLLLMLACFTTCGAVRAQSNARWQLSAESRYDYNATTMTYDRPVDSVKYSYATENQVAALVLTTERIVWPQIWYSQDLTKIPWHRYDTAWYFNIAVSPAQHTLRKTQKIRTGDASIDETCLYTYFVPNTYRLDERASYTYSSQRTDIGYLYRDPVSGNMLNNKIYMHKWDNNGDVYEGSFKYRFGSQWKNDSSFSRTIINRRITEEQLTIGDPIPANTWRRTYKYTGSSSLPDSMLLDNIDGPWLPVGRVGYTYDVSGKVQKKNIENWNPVSQLWEPVELYEYSFNTDGNATEILKKIWNAGTSAYDNDYKTSYTYSQGALSTSASYQYNVGSWEPATPMTFYYYNGIAPVGVASAEVADATLQVYPNPATSELHVIVGEKHAGEYAVSIVDMQGRVVQYFYPDSNMLNVNIKGLATGQYVLTVTSKDGKATKQFAVAR